MVAINPVFKSSQTDRTHILPSVTPTVSKHAAKLYVLHNFANIVRDFWDGIREARVERTLNDNSYERKLHLRADTNSTILHQYHPATFVNHLSTKAKEGYTEAAQCITGVTGANVVDFLAAVHIMAGPV